MGLLSWLRTREAPPSGGDNEFSVFYEETGELPEYPCSSVTQDLIRRQVGQKRLLGASAFVSGTAGSLVRRLKDLQHGLSAFQDRRFCRELIKAVSEAQYPPPPQVFSALYSLAPDAPDDLIVTQIEAAPEIAEAFVALVSTPHVGPTEKVVSLMSAVSATGAQQAAMLVLAIELQASLRSENYAQTPQIALADHSLLSAIAAQLMARRLGQDEVSAFYAALLHDIGRAYVQHLAYLAEPQPRPATVAQLEDGIHAAFGALLTHSMGLPAEVSIAIEHHHQPTPAIPQAVRPLAKLVLASDLMADVLTPHRATEDLAESTEELHRAFRALGLEPSLQILQELDEIYSAFQRGLQPILPKEGALLTGDVEYSPQQAFRP